MRHRLLACSLLALVGLVAFAQPGAAQVVGSPGDPTLVVYPTGIAPTDVTNVQYALDNVASPGTVLMESTDMGGNPLAFNFGGTTPGTGGVVKVLRRDITLTGDGWDQTLDEPKTKVMGGGGAFSFSPSMSGTAMVFAVRASGVTIREIKLTTSSAYTGIFIVSVWRPDWLASDHAVVIERNHVSVLNYAVLSAYTAAFPVRIDRNVFKANCLLEGRWTGFALHPIITPTLLLNYDEPVVPMDQSMNAVRYPFEVTNNKMIKTPGSTFSTLLVYGWANYYNGLANAGSDPDLGCRRYRESSSLPYIYQCVAGDNGPVLISGNRITLQSSPADVVSAIEVATYDGGLNHAIVAGNVVSGRAYAGIRRYAYGHDTIVMDNDFSGFQAAHQLSIQSADNVVADNVLGPVEPYAGWTASVPQPAVLLYSGNFYPGFSPMPFPTENCVLMQNDYRLTGLNQGAILLASRAELRYPTGAGAEVKNNIVFETGRFPGETDALTQVTFLDDITNPDTGLPYVHDNRVVGLDAIGLDDPGIGAAVRRVLAIRKALGARR